MNPYVPTNWLDDVPGIQTGTPINASNLNHLEGGAAANDDLASLLAQEVLQHKRALADLEGEISTVALTNSLVSTYGYPFNNSQATVNLQKSRDTINYRIIPEVISVTGGSIGDIVISDKALNGFKIAFTGSATSATIKYYVEGGMYQ